ncbi:uncharacterized protein SOCEGT47_002110 [Sorangium cellulosum]|uniref:Secreted protein n=1 Tax=Sorangium cellulosum TaxID=56 RepID=A0A4P2PT28_SORCE|nr:hypothetical protein [Sorangium cellulosum]AUX19759.1 uncharacterized protein SOCEGT47_002110 [Sorangium cellulosum]
MSVSNFSSPGATALAPGRSRLAVMAALAVSALLGAAGCAAEVRTRAVAPARPTVVVQELTVVEEPVVHTRVVPVDIEARPRVYYHGTYVYYVDGRWYYPTRHGWAYYRREPRALAQHRVHLERRSPHVHHHHRHHHAHRVRTVTR